MSKLAKKQLSNIKSKMDKIVQDGFTPATENEYWLLHEEYNRTFDLYYQAQEC